MKIVDSNNWAPRHKLNLPMPVKIYLRIYYCDGAGLPIYLPKLNIDEFYYGLVSVFYYNTLDEDNFYEDD
jgi:hypothetical protein